MLKIMPKNPSAGLVALLLVSATFLPSLSLSVSPSSAQEDDDPGFKYLEVTVLDPDGKPLADVEVEVSIDGAAFPMLTDEEGIIGFNVPGSGVRLRLIVQHEGYEAIGALWKREDKIPEEFTIALEKGVTIGGVVHDEEGQPVEGATIEGQVLYDSHVNGDEGEGDLRPMLDGEIATTDSEGRWQSDLASERKVHLQIKVVHPNYVSDNSVNFVGRDFKQLQSLDKVFVLRAGVDLRGRVLDPTGEPVVGANILLGRYRYSSNRLDVETNEQGEYQIFNAPPGTILLTATSADWAPQLMDTELSVGMEPLDIQLKQGNTVQIRVVDPDGSPLEGVRVSPAEWRGYETLENSQDQPKTNADGLWQWDNAPADEIRYSAWKKGYFSTTDYAGTNFSAGKQIHQITLLPEVVISGSVVDKETGQPIKEFTLIEGVWWDPQYNRYILQTTNEVAGHDGAFRHEVNSGCFKFLLKIVADGYLPAFSREIVPEEGQIHLNFELEAASPPSGIAKLPDGRPAEGAEIVMATPDRYVSIRDGEIRNRHGLLSATCDSEGRFAFDVTEGVYTLICLHEEGCGYRTREEFEESSIMQIQPWAQVTGKVQQGTQALAGEEVSLYCSAFANPDQPKIYWDSRSETDASGSFTFERVKAGTAAVVRLVKYAQTGDGQAASAYSHTAHAEVVAGETAQIVVGGEGRVLKGRLKMPQDYDKEVSWKMGIVQLIKQEDPELEKLPQQAYSPFNRQYASVITADGTYEIQDLLPGQYKLFVNLYPVIQPSGSWQPIGTLKHNVTVSEGGSEPLDLGELILEIKPEKPQQ